MNPEFMMKSLDEIVDRLGIACSDRQKRLLLSHLDMLIEKNKTLNLTRITSPQDALVLHIEDSLSILNEFNRSDGMYCDIGTGGGFPGIPLGIVSGRKGYLLDSVSKKAHAVQEFIEALGLEDQLIAVGSRSEEFSETLGGEFDTVVARAVSSLNVVEELATPLLRFKGRLVAMRGIESSEDLKYAQNASESLGLELVSQRTFDIGNGAYKRSVYVFEKVDEPKVKVPRRPGMATKRPLGIK